MSEDKFDTFIVQIPLTGHSCKQTKLFEDCRIIQSTAAYVFCKVTVRQNMFYHSTQKAAQLALEAISGIDQTGTFIVRNENERVLKMYKNVTRTTLEEFRND